MLKCLIVEDEPLATDVLVEYVKRVPFLHLTTTCPDAIVALDVLRREQVDLIFLDIHLPGLKGLEFVKTLQNPPAIILTTAYHQYAIEGYELNVVDYLLKPIEFARFLEAVNKVKDRLPSQHHKTIAIHSDKKTVLVSLEDILFIESQKEYIKILTTSAAHVTKYGLSKIEEELDPRMFIRVHRSFIVSISKIKAFSSHDIDLGGKSIPIGGNYREEVSKRLKEMFG
jgi:DNA-binding LytR/AlgR family response regulator